MPGESPRSAPEPAEFPVAHVHWTLPPVIGGVETYLADFTRELAARGHPVTVFTGRGELSGVPRVSTVRLELLDLDRYAGAPREPVDDKRLAEELAAVLGRELLARGIRVVHAHNLHHFSPVPALALESLQAPLGLRLHHTYHSLWDRAATESGADPVEICRGWPGQHTTSRYLREACERTLDVSTVQTYLGVSEDRYGEPAVPCADGHGEAVLLPARLVPEKGAMAALAAVAALRAEGRAVRLLLTTPEQTVDWDRKTARFKAEVQREIGRLGLGPHVEFRGVGFDEMPRLYASADVVVYPSTYPEPLGIAPLEAAAAGRPVIVTDIGGLRETVLDGATGYVVPPGDAGALTDRLRTLLADPARARSMGAAGRERVLAEFGLSAHVDRMIEHYRRISA